MAIQVFNCKQIEEIIKFSMDSSKGDYKLPVALWGLAGVGKTEFVAQVAKRHGYNLVVLHLATQGDICDLIGMPKTIEVKDNTGKTISATQFWSCPEWLSKALDNAKETGKPNLFFLDEFNRGNRLVLNAMLPFLIEGRLHTHRINKEDAIICAMNPPTDNYEVNSISDEALLNRVGHCIFKPTNDEYIKFLQSTGMDAVTITVLKQNPEFMKISDFKLDFEIIPTRRSIDHVMKIIGKKPAEWLTKYAPYVIEAYLGDKFGDAWISEYSKKGCNLTIDMLIDYDNNAQFITETLTTKIDGIKTERVDIVSKLIESIKSWVDEYGDNLTIKDIEWMFKFFNNPMVPSETCASLFKGHPVFKNKMKFDREFNSRIYSFLVAKGIINEPKLLSDWIKL